MYPWLDLLLRCSLVHDASPVVNRQPFESIESFSVTAMMSEVRNSTLRSPGSRVVASCPGKPNRFGRAMNELVGNTDVLDCDSRLTLVDLDRAMSLCSLTARGTSPNWSRSWMARVLIMSGGWSNLRVVSLCCYVVVRIGW